MEYLFSGKTFPINFKAITNEVPQEAFNYDEIKVRDKMMVSPFEVGSVVYFFMKAMIVANVETSHALKSSSRKTRSALFAAKLASLFETIEDKTSTPNKTNMGLYGKL